MGRPRSWTDEQLREAVASSASITEVLRKLGLAKGGATVAVVRKRMLQLGLDAPHIRRRVTSSAWDVDPSTLSTSKPRGRTWSDADLARAVAGSCSLAGVHRRLGLKIGGGTYPMLKARIRELGLDMSHFTGQGWNKGGRVPNSVPMPLEKILVKDSTYRNTHKLRLRLIKEGYKAARCESCALTEWRGRSMPLQLDHVNGDRTDNRLENLRLLCPNCHAQTDTWCRKRASRVTINSSVEQAPVVKSVYTRHSNWRAARHEGSSPSRSTDHTGQPTLF